MVADPRRHQAVPVGALEVPWRPHNFFSRSWHLQYHHYRMYRVLCSCLWLVIRARLWDWACCKLHRNCCTVKYSWVIFLRAALTEGVGLYGISGREKVIGGGRGMEGGQGAKEEGREEGGKRAGGRREWVRKAGWPAKPVCYKYKRNCLRTIHPYKHPIPNGWAYSIRGVYVYGKAKCNCVVRLVGEAQPDKRWPVT